MNRDAVIAILRREKPFLEQECGVVSLALLGSVDTAGTWVNCQKMLIEKRVSHLSLHP
jgi:hypothetical protein